MSIIAAGTTAGTALKSTGNTDGTIQLQVNGTTPSVTLATTGAIGVGSTPGYGTSGQVLQSAGSAAAPTWSTLSTGSMVFLSSVTASSSATVTIDTTFNSTYDTYMIVFSNVTGTVDASGLITCTLNIGGTYQTAAYYGNVIDAATTAANASAITNAANFELNSSPLRIAPNTFSGVMYINNPSSTTVRKQVYGQTYSNTPTPGSRIYQYAAYYSGSTAALTGVRFSASASAIATGTFRLYGIKNS